MTRHGIYLDVDSIRDLCRRHGIAEVYVFGSFLREDFGPHSDVDLLVRPGPGERSRFSQLLSFEDEIAQIAGRPVDGVLTSELEEPGANPYRRREVLNTMEPLVV